MRAGLWPATTAFEPACLGFRRHAATTGGPLHASLRNEHAQIVHRRWEAAVDPHFYVAHLAGGGGCLHVFRVAAWGRQWWLVRRGVAGRADATVIVMQVVDGVPVEAQC